MLRACFALATRLGKSVQEIGVQISWPELQYWIALFQIEAELALPPDKRPKKIKTPEEAAETLNKFFGTA